MIFFSFVRSSLFSIMCVFVMLNLNCMCCVARLFACYPPLKTIKYRNNLNWNLVLNSVDKYFSINLKSTQHINHFLFLLPLYAFLSLTKIFFLVQYLNLRTHHFISVFLSLDSTISNQ